MARPRPVVEVPVAPKGFVASAVNLPTMDRNVAGASQGWQRQAWTYWETVGELRYPTQWIGNVMSRATLHAAHLEGSQLVIQDSGPAREAMDALFGGLQGHAEMLKAFGVNLSVAGEGYLVYIARGEQWFVVASGKCRQLGRKGSKGAVVVDLGLSSGEVTLTPSDFALRIWTPHPRNSTQADSPTRANLTALGQICGYDAHIQAQLDSRLAGAGILMLPSEIDFQIPAGADPAASQASAFMAVLGQAMMTPIKDRSNPSALVPIVVMAPGEHLDKAQHLKFWSDLDDKVVSMRDAAIKRLALGIDVPPEILLGVADATHWNAWLSEESAIKAHLEPRLTVITHGLTTGYLRPALEEVPDPHNWFVVADTAPIRLRPNRSQEALELHNRGELSGEALRRETGFLPTDAPVQEELVQWLLRRVATAASSPEASLAALAELGIDLGTVAEASRANRGPADNIRVDTGPRRRDARDEGPSPPALAAGATDPLLAACEVLVYRALERAGNRLRNTHRLTDTTAMPTHAVYRFFSGDPDHLLEGSWECALDVLSDYAPDPANVIDVLDFYVRGLIGTKREPSRTVLSTLLATRPTPLEAVPT